jgi:anti-sigma regulatory factor (Ser/Thr protein kinase)
VNRIEVPATPASVPAVKRVLRAALSDRAESPDVHDALVCVSEALTNVVDHGADEEIELAWDLTGSILTLVIREPRGTPPPDLPVERPSSEAARGRGLYLIHRLADGVAYQVDRHSFTLVIRKLVRS